MSGFPLLGDHDWERSKYRACVDLLLERLGAGADPGVLDRLRAWGEVVEAAKDGEELTFFLRDFRDLESLAHADDLSAVLQRVRIPPAVDPMVERSTLYTINYDAPYLAGDDALEKPSSAQLEAVKAEIVALEHRICEIRSNAWRPCSVRNDAREFLGAIALEFLTVGGYTNANLLRVKDRLLNCQALIDTHVHGRLV